MARRPTDIEFSQNPSKIIERIRQAIPTLPSDWFQPGNEDADLKWLYAAVAVALEGIQHQTIDDRIKFVIAFLQKLASGRSLDHASGDIEEKFEDIPRRTIAISNDPDFSHTWEQLNSI